MNTSHHIILLCLTIILCSCAKIYHKSKFTLADRPFVPHPELGIDGFYINTSVVAERRPYSLKQLCASPMVLYGDGTVLKLHANYCEDWLQDQSADALIDKIVDRIKFNIRTRGIAYKTEPNIWDWGMYRIDGDDIEMQVYKNHQGDYHLVDYWGIVKSDTTITFEISTDRAKKTDREVINEEYRFYHYPIKPDSTNYIKEHLDDFMNGG